VRSDSCLKFPSVFGNLFYFQVFLNAQVITAAIWKGLHTSFLMKEVVILV